MEAPKSRYTLVKRLLFCTSLGLFSLAAPLPFFSLGSQSIPHFRIQEERARGLFKKALLFYHSQRYAAAREFFYKALAVQPHFHLARRFLGDSYYYSGQWGEALEQWEFLDKLSNHSYPLTKQRSQLLRFQLGNENYEGKYVFLQSFHPKSWPGYHFRGPTDIAFGPAGEIYLNSFSSANILALSPSGSPMKEISGPFYDSLSAPLSSAVDQKGNVYVSDYKEDRVRVFSSPSRRRSRELFSFGSSGKKPGQFYGPSNLLVHQNSVFVSDSGNRRVQKFSTKGRFLLEMGRNTSVEAPLHPAGLALDREKTLYLADRDGARILRFDIEGNFLGELNSRLLKKPRGLHIHKNKLIIADEEGGIFFYDTVGQVWSTLSREEEDQPSSSFQEEAQAPALAEGPESPPLGREERRLASEMQPQFVRPFAARVDPRGALYVADYGANRLLLYVPLGMRISNLNCKIQKIDTRSFPKIALFVSTQNRFGTNLGSLNEKSFHLYENDSRIRSIKVDNMSPFNRRISIGLVKENSHFYAENYEKYLQSSIGGLLSSLRIADSLYLIEAGRDSRLIYEGLERRKISRLLRRKENRGDEGNISKSLYDALTRTSKKIGPRAVVLMISGKDYPSAFKQYPFERIVQYAHSHEIPIHVLSYEGEQKLEKRKESIRLYKELAQRTKGHYFRAFDERALSKLYETISKRKDTRYIITYKTGLSPRLKGRYVEIGVELRYLGASGLADSGYFIP